MAQLRAFAEGAVVEPAEARRVAQLAVKVIEAHQRRSDTQAARQRRYRQRAQLRQLERPAVLVRVTDDRGDVSYRHSMPEAEPVTYLVEQVAVTSREDAGDVTQADVTSHHSTGLNPAESDVGDVTRSDVTPPSPPDGFSPPYNPPLFLSPLAPELHHTVQELDGDSETAPAVPEEPAVPEGPPSTAPLPRVASAPLPTVGRETWMTPYWDSWQAAGGSQMQARKHAPFLARLERRHGAAETLARWNRMLELTPLRFASAAKLEEAWGDFAVGVDPVRAAGDSDEARAGRFYDLAVASGWLSAPDADAVRRRVETARRRVQGLSWVDGDVVEFLLRLDRRSVNEAGNRRWAIDRLLNAGRVPVVTVLDGGDE
jgi:hypothetical protein